MLDLRYEARDIDQRITSQAKIDQWFEAKTKGLTDLAKAQLKQRWGTMQKVLSSQVAAGADRRRHPDGHGDPRPAARAAAATPCWSPAASTRRASSTSCSTRPSSKGKCAIVTSYRPSAADLKGEESGEGETEKLRQYDIYQQMLADWFNEAAGDGGEQSGGVREGRSRRSSSTSRAR